MEKYTKETLLPLNESYNVDHRLSDQDVFVANIYRFAIERSRSLTGKPKAGDIVMFNGKLAHIESVEGTDVSVCEGAYTPFITCKFSDSYPDVRMNTSGGPWYLVALDRFKVTDEKREKEFCFFGHCGMRGNGAVHFKALVNVFVLK